MGLCSFSLFSARFASPRPTARGAPTPLATGALNARPFRPLALWLVARCLGLIASVTPPDALHTVDIVGCKCPTGRAQRLFVGAATREDPTDCVVGASPFYMSSDEESFTPTRWPPCADSVKALASNGDRLLALMDRQQRPGSVRQRRAAPYSGRLDILVHTFEAPEPASDSTHATMALPWPSMPTSTFCQSPAAPINAGVHQPSPGT